MPVLTLKVCPAPDPALGQSLAAALTRITAELLGKRPEVTAVLVEGLADSAWFIGSATVKPPTALLEISITAGTNTAEQKARFIEAAFAELNRQLAQGTALATASYVMVREVPSTDWGYGGMTQAARRKQRR